MKILTIIHRNPGINTNGRTIHRTAVRAIALRGRQLLMILSTRVGDFKFPGGGVDQGETHAQALHREVREECGLSVSRVGTEIGTTIEYETPDETDYDVFQLTSHYYQCEVQGEFGTQKLDDYEAELGFQPVWIDIEDALRYNNALLGSENMPEWLRREIFMLEYITKNMLAP